MQRTASLLLCAIALWPWCGHTSERLAADLSSPAQRQAMYHTWAADPDHHHYTLGLMAWYGQGRSVDREQAIVHFQQAADAGDPDAQLALAMALYQHHRHPQAFAYLKQAALAGLPAAQHNLSVFYRHGWGTPHDAVQAAHWAKQAAPRCPSAALHLALLYTSGTGVIRDRTMGAAWLNHVYHTSHPARQQAKALRDLLFAQMTSDAVQEALSRSMPSAAHRP